MCYINCSLDYEVIDDFGKILENNHYIKILNRFPKHLTVSFVYKPPNATKSWEEIFLKYLEKCSSG